jgi:hypothetical protein
MAIRPADLQNAIVQSVQNPPLAQRAEEGPRQAQAAAQAAFVAQTSTRNESIAQAGDAQGNKVGDRSPDRDAANGRGRKRERKPGDPFDEVVEEAAGLGEPAHLIDFTA